MILTDTHSHLYSSQFDEDREQAIKNAFEKGIERIFLPNIDHSSIEDMLALESQYPNKCFPMMGLHPCYVKENYEEELRTVENWLNKRSFCAIGEIGIDLYWDKSTLAIQQEAFRFQIKLAKKHELPIVIHCRDAFDEIFEILEEEKDDKLFGIFHCFTGNIDQAKQAIRLGFKLGIGGVVTFKKAGLDKVVAAIDTKDIVLETDAPYLAPSPFRGKRNESSYLIYIAEKVAELHQISIEELAAITTQNSQQVFNC